MDSSSILQGVKFTPYPAQAPAAASTENELTALKEMMQNTVLKLHAENQALRARLALLDGIFPEDTLPDILPPDFQGFFANRALHKLVRDFDFNTVLDIGSGQGMQAKVLLRHGKQVTALDYGKSPYYQWRDPAIKTVIGDFNCMDFDQPFDCVWASHVLEHQPNPNLFLKRVHAAVREGGVVAITVPPLKHQIVGGHLSLWNGGMLLYHMVLAGFDCSQASLLQYGYNISIIVRKRSIDFPGIVYDMGDIRTIRPFLPTELAFQPNQNDDPFNGDIHRLNW
ncbi:bifunctional 2-polyprenyl-6-hydroxyphenol methylase/3-demethylubiquinol 3-O-methyltransferase UbiG [Rhizobium sp. SSA_523]|uniref:class I SAM-dependent methyltransferase n=1 Tax=Rhizobium sp. SSA_523 TaxID=2952477 RepID=UPI002091CA6C|nr:class I SAM-dependent methyltransferase [Rhizobium sp. SSA_523]MCO5730745.1 class I SAM-dependent methyltransferase [Rhizobium sp. SSA_523]WKC24431.1 class I SAM-dependent methyltransferase [Rhizobium sp. SSA_523]